jgi:hypothetical protein
VTSDPYDYIYVEAQVGVDGRQRRRRITIPDGDWHPVGDPAAPGGIDARLRAQIIVNGVHVDVELLACELEKTTSAGQDGERRLTRQSPIFHVRNCMYFLTGRRQQRLTTWDGAASACADIVSPASTTSHRQSPAKIGEAYPFGVLRCTLLRAVGQLPDPCRTTST